MTLSPPHLISATLCCACFISCVRLADTTAAPGVELHHWGQTVSDSPCEEVKRQQTSLCKTDCCHNRKIMFAFNGNLQSSTQGKNGSDWIKPNPSLCFKAFSKKSMMTCLTWGTSSKSPLKDTPGGCVWSHITSLLSHFILSRTRFCISGSRWDTCSGSCLQPNVQQKLCSPPAIGEGLWWSSKSPPAPTHSRSPSAIQLSPCSGCHSVQPHSN